MRKPRPARNNSPQVTWVTGNREWDSNPSQPTASLRPPAPHRAIVWEWPGTTTPFCTLPLLRPARAPQLSHPLFCHSGPNYSRKRLCLHPKASLRPHLNEARRRHCFESPRHCLACDRQCKVQRAQQTPPQVRGSFLCGQPGRKTFASRCCNMKYILVHLQSNWF